jgi:hypothetical protein
MLEFTRVEPKYALSHYSRQKKIERGTQEQAHAYGNLVNLTILYSEAFQEPKKTEREPSRGVKGMDRIM